MHAHLSKFEVTLRYLSADNIKMCPVKVSKEKKKLAKQNARIHRVLRESGKFTSEIMHFFSLKMSTENEFRVQVHSWFPEEFAAFRNRNTKIYLLLANRNSFSA